MLWEVAIMEHPTVKEAEEGRAEKLVFGPKAVVAKDAQSAAVSAVLDQNGKLEVNRERMEIIVRPFGQAPSK